jgi:hypothetical protein
MYFFIRERLMGKMDGRPGLKRAIELLKNGWRPSMSLWEILTIKVNG